MKPYSRVIFTSLFLCLFLAALPAVHAQKLSRKAVRALRVQEARELRQITNAATQATTSNAAFRSAAASVAVQMTSGHKIPPTGFSPTSKKAREAFFKGQKLKDAARVRILPQVNSGKYAKKHTGRLPFDPAKKVEQLLDENASPVDALKALWRLEDLYHGKHFFKVFSTAYYKRNFTVITPHLRELFAKTEQLGNRDLEIRLIKRMRFLSENRDNFRAAFAPDSFKAGIRMRYVKDIGRLTPEGFNARDLAFSFERKMNPMQPRAAVRHVNAHSQFPVGKNFYPVYEFGGPPEYLPNLYRYLVNGKNLRADITMIFDPNARSLAVYNNDKSLWLRITPHEYASPQRLHIHLNEMRTGSVTSNLGLSAQETVHFNLSIPLAEPQQLPKDVKPEDYLYEQFVLRPVKHFRGDAHVTIIERPIF